MRRISGVFAKRAELNEVKRSMTLAAGSETINIPAMHRDKYRFITVDNSENDVILTLSANGVIRRIGRNCIQTFPIPPEMIDSLTVAWPALAATDGARFTLYFAAENLNYNVAFGIVNPFV